MLLRHTWQIYFFLVKWSNMFNAKHLFCNKIHFLYRFTVLFIICYWQPMTSMIYTMLNNSHFSSWIPHLVMRYILGIRIDKAKSRVIMFSVKYCNWSETIRRLRPLDVNIELLEPYLIDKNQNNQITTHIRPLENIIIFLWYKICYLPRYLPVT